MKITTNERAVAYVRVSTTEQAEQGYSIDAQIQTIKDYCQKSGLVLTQVYADKGISGKSLKKRVQLQQLLSDAKQSKFDRVIVWKNSRLARNVKLLLEIIDTFQAHNIEFDSISENIQIDTASGKFMLQMLASVSEFERNEIAENVRLGMRKRARDGLFNGNRVLGYDNVVADDGTKTLAINQNEALIVRFIFDSYHQGHGFRWIANELNHRGDKTKRGNTFSTIAVKDILKNPLYVGKIQYGKYENWETKRRRGRSQDPILVEGQQSAIIDKAIWSDIQSSLLMRSRMPEWTHQGSNVLTGLLRCPECGGPMVASNTTNRLKDGTKKRVRYYSCGNFRNKGSAVCHANSIRADEAEKLVGQKLIQVLSTPLMGEKVVQKMREQQMNTQTTVKRIFERKQAEIAELTEKRRRLQDTIELEPSVKDSLEPRLRQLIRQQTQLENERDDLQNGIDGEDVRVVSKDVEALLRLVAEVIEGQDKQTLKVLYRLFIDRVTFDRKKKLVWVYLRFDDDVMKKLSSYTEKTTSVGVAFLRGPVSIFL